VTPAPAPPAVGKLTIGLLYFAGVVQGLALVTFPAAGPIFQNASGFHLSQTQYGAMFAPQVAFAILASALGPLFARGLGLRGVLLLGLGGDVAAMAMLSASPLLVGSPAAYILLLVATGALGLGFGATVMALNTLIEGLFPRRADGAVLALNALLGLGTALAPLLVAAFTALGAWWALPLAMASIAAMLLLAFAFRTAPLGPAYRAAGGDGGGLAALLYGLVETLCGNWAAIYLSTERHVTARDASFALTAFWACVTLGRVLFAFVDRVLPAKWIYVALPLALAAVFQFIASAHGATAGIFGFAAAGLACSAMLPLSVSFAGSEFPRRAASMSGDVIAIYQIGYGVAAFGVAPLRSLSGLSFGEVYALGGLFALSLAAVAAGLAMKSPVSSRSGTSAPA
jgi:fucose permease